MSMKFTTLLALVCLALPTVSHSGENVEGRIVLHVDAAVVYTGDHSGYCSPALATCSAAVTEMDNDGSIAIIYFLAAFSDEKADRLTGITFGIDYPTDFYVVDSGSCGTFELATSQWPASGNGTAVTWESPQSGDLIPLYWFAAYTDVGSTGTFSVIPHPSQGASFADGSVPAVIDPVAGFGSIGFGSNGAVSCPAPPATSGGTWGSLIGQ